MWSRAQLKANAKAAMSNYFGKGFAVLLIYGVIAGVVASIYSIASSVIKIMGSYPSISKGHGANYYHSYSSTMEEWAIIALIVLYVVYIACTIFIIHPILIGVYRFYQRSRGIPTDISEMFVPMKKFGHIGLAMLVMTVKVLLWSLLLIVPGIIKAFEYSMVPYVLAENPDISIKRAFEISKSMTDGHKWDLFVLGLSFILWVYGGLFTCGLLYIYVMPYMMATYAEAYYRLKAEAVFRGEVSLMELPDICMPVQPPVPPFVPNSNV